MSLTKRNHEQYFQQMQDDFINHCELAENGDLNYIDCAVKFRQEMEDFTELANQRKEWLNIKTDEITTEAVGYGREGYKGYIFTKQTKETAYFDEIPQWTELNKEIKEIEAEAKNNWKALKNGVKIDPEALLPKIKYSSYIKTEKTNKKP